MSNHYNLLIEVKADLTQTAIVAMAVRGICEMTTLTPTEISRVELCLVEVLNNIIEHAYAHKTDQKIEIIVDLSGAALSLTISDWGICIPQENFNPNPEELADNKLLQTHGRGIFIIQSLMDDINYTSKNKKNSLTMRININ